MDKYNIEIFCDDEENANTYLITNDQEAIIIDPANNIKILSKYIQDKNILGILLTHGHYDHFKELDNLRKLYPVKCYMHKNAYNKIHNINTSYANCFRNGKTSSIVETDCVFIHEQQIINLGSFEIKVLYTPGHTDCSVIYILDHLMFSGDTLFMNSVGRTDLTTGSRIMQMNSLDRIKHLKEDYEIYPGHGDKTTLFIEQKNNHYLN